MEATSSACLKVGLRRVDLSKRTEDAMSKDHSFYSWEDQNVPPYFRLDSTCAAARPPPLLPDEVRRLLEQEKKFTAKSDVGVVADLHRSFFECACTTPSLKLSGLGWGEAEAAQLAVVLPRFAGLCSLDLSNNKFGPADVALLAPVLKELQQLSSLKCAACRTFRAR